jgi:Ca2+-binding EF-hand superfamily protein
MKNVRSILVLAVALAGSSAAIATSDAGELWKSLDVNKDGVISKDEGSASQEVSAQWSLLDLNQDGVLSEKEFSLISLSK